MSAQGYADAIPAELLEAEEATLGSVLLDPQALLEVYNTLRVGDFSHPHHRAIYAAMLSAHDAGDTPDLIRVGAYLDKVGRLRQVGGTPALARLAGAVPSSIHIEHYADLVRSASIRRTLVGVSERIAALGTDTRRDAREALEEAQGFLLALAEADTTNAGVLIEDAAAAYYARLLWLVEHQGQLSGVDTGFGGLNRLTGGLQASDLVILASRPGQGKSSLALGLALSAARAGQAVAFFSLEMPSEQLTQRAVAIDSGVDAQRLRQGRLYGDEPIAVQQAVAGFAGVPLTIYDAPALTLGQLRAQAMRHAAGEGLGLIIVDYLQMMKAPKAEGRQQEVAAISRGLKGIARELQVPVLALAQLSRAIEQRADKKPQLSDLRESGGIEADADMVIFIHRETGQVDDPNLAGLAELHIAKHRNGPTGILPLRFVASTTRFCDFPEPPGAAPAAQPVRPPRQPEPPPRQGEFVAPADDDEPVF